MLQAAWEDEKATLLEDNAALLNENVAVWNENTALREAFTEADSRAALWENTAAQQRAAVEHLDKEMREAVERAAAEVRVPPSVA
jgi:hypothetical protein